MTIMRMSSPKPESAYHIAKSPIYDVCVLPTLNEDPVASEACMTGQVRCRSEPVSPAPRPDSWAPRRTASADTRRKPAHRRHSRDVSSIPNQQSKSVLSADADAFLIALNLFREQELDRPGMIHMRNGDSAQRGDHTGSVPAGSVPAGFVVVTVGVVVAAVAGGGASPLGQPAALSIGRFTTVDSLAMQSHRRPGQRSRPRRHTVL